MIAKAQRALLLAASRNDALREAVERAPVTRDLVHRFVAGTGDDHALEAAAEQRSRGLLVTLDRLGEDVADEADAARTRDAYVGVLGRLSALGLSDGGDVEVSVKLSALGQALGRDGESVALENARTICEAAALAGTTVTLDMEDHTTVDSTLRVLEALRAEHPWVGAVLQSQLRRTEADCRDLATTGSRVRLCKGAYAPPETVAFTDPHGVDRSYVRCLKVLLHGEGYPMLATHDPLLLEIGEAVARDAGRDADAWEVQMLLGVRPQEQARLGSLGRRVRVYVPYGDDWYAYLVRRLAERPANLALLLRSLTSRS
ncbi:proline dehydrogenase family protein [Aquipuribacter nitratireducens]|uniref:proline dehydrogenase n=1 Tax=Aquipuribacter nitratireducens TaxID=650104 RepID=A0ABW0GSJ6_9MICO